MKVLLDIQEEKVAFIMELLNNFNFVKAQPLTPYKAGILENLKEAVEEVNLIKKGEKEAVSLADFLNEL